MAGICPKCGSMVSKVKLTSVEVISAGGGHTLKGVSFLCQGCNCVLSVSIPPIPSTADSEVSKALADN
jgi:hypothetical protein